MNVSFSIPNELLSAALSAVGGFVFGWFIGGRYAWDQFCERHGLPSGTDSHPTG